MHIAVFRSVCWRSQTLHQIASKIAGRSVRKSWYVRCGRGALGSCRMRRVCLQVGSALSGVERICNLQNTAVPDSQCCFLPLCYLIFDQCGVNKSPAKNAACCATYTHNNWFGQTVKTTWFQSGSMPIAALSSVCWRSQTILRIAAKIAGWSVRKNWYVWDCNRFGTLPRWSVEWLWV